MCVLSEMKDNAIEMAKRLLVDSIWKSANLEGLGTTFPKTEAILANAPTTTRTEEVLFIINMKRAWHFLFDNLEYPDTLMLLRKYNQIVGDILFNFLREMRKIPIPIDETSWKPKTPQTGIIMDSMTSIELTQNVEMRALKYFCFVARTQMFIDGNKRVATLIANKVLIENNVGIFQIPIERLEDFKSELLHFYETGDDVSLIDFMLKYCIKKVQREQNPKMNEINSF